MRTIRDKMEKFIKYHMQVKKRLFEKEKNVLK